MKTVTLTLAAAAIGITGMAAPAMANNITVKTETVSYAGINLNTIEGQDLLERRVESAARRVCNYDRSIKGAGPRRDARKCLAKARIKARQQVATVIEDQRRGG